MLTVHFFKNWLKRTDDGQSSYDAVINTLHEIGRPEEAIPMYRHAVLTRGSFGLAGEQVEELIEVAMTECERFYPAFQFVVWGGKTAEEAVMAAMLETVGEA